MFKRLTATNKQSEWKVFPIPNSNPTKTNNEIANIICEILDDINPKKYPHKKLLEFVEDRSGHDKRYAIDSSKIQTKLKWKPIFTFEDALKITINWYFNKFKLGENTY